MADTAATGAGHDPGWRPLAEQMATPQDFANVPIIRDPAEMFRWDTWLGPNGLDESILGDGPTYSDGSLCLDAVIAGQGVFPAWDTLACGALESGRLVAPFPGRYATGLAYWFVVGRRANKPREVREFERWLRRELGVGVGVV